MPTRPNHAVYLRERAAKFREDFTPVGECENCGTTENLEWDHIDPSTKVANVGAMVGCCFSREAIIAEIAKCRILCGHCNTLRANARISEADVQAIRIATGTQKEIAVAFGVSQSQVSRIRSGKRRAIALVI